MHSLPVVQKYGQRRFFLACDGFSDAEALFTGIARLFGVAEGRKMGYLKRTITGIEDPVLLTLG